jgi:hypothetical protein
MPGTIGILKAVETLAGVKDTGEPGSYTGFLTLRAVAENGDILIGQVTPAELREQALSLLSAAEAAEQDATVMSVLVTHFSVPFDTASAVIHAMRNARTP